MQKYIKLLALLSLAILVPAVSLKNINKIGVYALTGPGPSVTPTPTIVLTPPSTVKCGLNNINFLGQCKKGFEKATFDCKLNRTIIYTGSVSVPNRCATRDELKTQANKICLSICNKRLNESEITLGL